MGKTGHVLIGMEGRFLNVDTAFGELMRSSPDAMIGRSVIEMTAPADRAECIAAITRLRQTEQPFQISKRFVRDDGSLLWVTNTVSITGGSGAAPVIIATIEPIERRDEVRSPAMLLEAARFIDLSRRQRARVCGPDLAGEPAWELILAAYIIEAEGGVLDLEAMARRGGMSLRSAARWLAVLLDRDLLERELGRDGAAAGAFRLSAAAHRRFERYLSMVQSEHEALQVLKRA